MFNALLMLLGFTALTDLQPAAVLAVAVLGALGLLLVQRFGVSPFSAGSPARVRGAVLRARALRLAFLVIRDPDGPGRTRPRAPGPAPAAAGM
jgi:hypothetical protein